MTRSGADLALLMLAGFRSLVDDAVAALEARGYPDYRPVYDFALRAVLAGADSTSELGRRLAVSKQAAAKTVAVLEERGYLARRPHPSDARANRLEVTEAGADVLREGGKVFDNLRRQWERKIGREQVDALERHLRVLVGEATIRFDTPGWMVRDLGQAT